MATKSEVEFWKDVSRKQSGWYDKARKARDEAIRLQVAADDARKTAQAVADGLEWQIDDLSELVVEMYGFIHEACKRYPRMFDPNIGAGCQMVREMPDVRFAGRMRDMGIEVPNG